MEKLIELIEKHRDKWQRKWTKGSQLRDNNSEHYDVFLHGESVGATKAYNNVLQWMKNTSITKSEKDIALTWKDVKDIDNLISEVLSLGPFPNIETFYTIVLKRFNAKRNEKEI